MLLFVSITQRLEGTAPWSIVLSIENVFQRFLFRVNVDGFIDMLQCTRHVLSYKSEISEEQYLP